MTTDNTDTSLKSIKVKKEDDIDLKKKKGFDLSSHIGMYKPMKPGFGFPEMNFNQNLYDD